MVMVTVREGVSFYLNKKEKQNLDIGLQAMKQSVQDLVFVIDGAEGSGKSKKARQLAAYCAMVLGSKFDFDGIYNIHNDIDKYIDSSLESPEFAVHVLDEGRQVLNRKRSMGREAVRFTNYMSECRGRRQVHIILLPAFHDLDSYVALWRMDLLWHLSKHYEKVEDDYVLKLGEYRLYANNAGLKKYYEWKYSHPKIFDVRDRFSNVEILTDKGLIEYEAQKNNKLDEKYASDAKKASDKGEQTFRATLGKNDKGNRIAIAWPILRTHYTKKELSEAFGWHISNSGQLDKRYLTHEIVK